MTVSTSIRNSPQNFKIVQKIYTIWLANIWTIAIVNLVVVNLFKQNMVIINI